MIFRKSFDPNEFAIMPAKTVCQLDSLTSERVIHSSLMASYGFRKPHLRDQFHQRFGIVFNQVLRAAVQVWGRGIINIQSQMMEQRGVDFTE